MNKETLIEEFIKKTSLSGKYTESGDHKKINALFKEIVAIIKNIYNFDPEFNSLEKLLNHENASVKNWVATVLLFTDKKDKACVVLKSVSKNSGLVAFTAQMTLKEWEAGRLKPLYEL